MRSGLIAALGLLTLAIGVLWIGQGSGLVDGSGMSGQAQWLVVGILVTLGGTALMLYGLGSRKRPTPPPDL